MVNSIIINDLKDIDSSIRSLSKIKRRLPQLTSDTMMQWGKMLETSMKNSAKQAGIKSNTGELFGKGIEWRQRPRGKKGALFIRIQGVYLDSMRPHHVNIIRRRTRLLAWALQSNNIKIRQGAHQVQKGARRAFPIFVKPKPFIHRGYKRARKRLKPMLKRVSKIAVMHA